MMELLRDPIVQWAALPFVVGFIAAAITHESEGPDDMPAHIKAALNAGSLTIPVTGGRPALGTWQGIYLFEHRDRPQPTGRGTPQHLNQNRGATR